MTCSSTSCSRGTYTLVDGAKFGATWPAQPGHYELGVKFWKLNGDLLQEGKVKTQPVTVKDGGLVLIPEG